MSSLVSLSAAGRRWGPSVALRSVDLSLEAGENVALIGPSGSGKTTLLRLLVGGLEPTEGTVQLDGASIATMSTRQLQRFRRRCRLVPQTVVPLGNQRVHEYVVAGVAMHWPAWKVAASIVFPMEEAAVQEVLMQVGLAQRQWDPLATLSGGQRQRAAVARALLGKPDLLVADEPTASLDPALADEVLQLLTREFPKSAVVISTHAARSVLPYVSRVVALREGTVCFDGPAADVTEALFADVYRGSDELR